MIPARVPRIVQWLLPGYTWRIPTKERVLHLTFDDGPIPGVTPWVLDVLAQAGAKATFFCIGRNCEAEPRILDRIRAEGHGVGDHTWDHPRGRRTDTETYLKSVARSSELTSRSVFRPPYGSLTREQARALRANYRIVLWDVLSGDYDPRVDADECTRRVITHALPGSIVVFHDSLKAESTLRGALPRILEHFSQEGYRFEALPFAMAG
ncbi:MAG: polysaccharide deacetylase family protein [Flavobacteriales bacterium]|nr:polysaccharide deacetylase family protein [Flavobacteriales bacterium]